MADRPVSGLPFAGLARLIPYLRWGAPLIVMLAYSILHWWQPPLLQAVRTMVFDFYVAQKPRPYDPNLPVRIVDIDDESLTRLGQWPWPRTRTARLVNALQKAGAKVIAFDMVFADPDRTSISRLLPDLQKDFAANNVKFDISKIGEAPDNDLILSEVVGRGRVVTGFTFLAHRNEAIPARKAMLLSDDPEAMTHLSGFDGALKTLDPIELLSEGNGAFSALPDPDGVIRLLPLAFTMKGGFYPSLVAEALRVFADQKAIRLEAAHPNPLWRLLTGDGIRYVQISEYRIPTDASGRVRLYDSKSQISRYLPAWEVIAGETDPDELEGMIVFIGTSAMGLGDIRATPLERAIPGVEVHAQIAEQALTGSFLVVPHWGLLAEFTIFGVFSALTCLANWRRRIGVASFFAFLGGLILIGGSIAGFHYRHWLLDPVLPGAGLALVLGSAAAAGYASAAAERQRVRFAFNRYLAPAAIDQLVNDPNRLKLGGEMRDMTFLFSDIRGFTSISEKLSPDELTRFINHFLTPMTKAIMDTGGTIDKYMGDCIMAFWNAPLNDGRHGENACRAALKMLEELERLQEEIALIMPGVRIDIGIGINSGPCCVGNLGSEYRFDYSVLGNDVNIASRLEGQSKSYGVTALVGENTRAMVMDFAMLELDQIIVKGKSEPVTVWGLLGDADMQKEADFTALSEMHHRMLSCYRKQDFAAAAELTARLSLNETARRLRLEELYALYAERIATYMRTPPGAEWNGVYVALSK